MFSVGDVVLFQNENTPRCFWRLSQICELVPSKDDLIRYVWINVTTEGKIKKLHRPVELLTPLDVIQENLITNNEL